MWAFCWKTIIGLAAVAQILSWVETSTLLPQLPARAVLMLAAVSHYLNGLVSLCILAALSMGLWKLGRIEGAREEERRQREKEFQGWIHDKDRSLSTFFDARIDRLTNEAKDTERRALEAIDRFHKSYDGRLLDVETLSEEGPWATVQAGERSFKLTELAYKDFASRDQETQQRVIQHLLWSGAGRFHKVQVQRAAGDFFKPREGGEEWSYDTLAGYPDDQRMALFTKEPALWRWYEDREKGRRKP